MTAPSSSLCPALSLPVMAILLALAFPAELRAAPPQGTWVNLAADGRLLYTRDSLGNRVPDFGNCGYKAGRLPIPQAPVKVTVNPGEGDDRAAIEAAIDQVAAMPMDANGIRGAVVLTAGEYQMSSTLNINASGVVLRGAGASDAGTRLRATDPRQYTLVNISGTGSPATVANTKKAITDKYVPVGARSFMVNDTTNLAVGHSIVVSRPGNAAWLKELGMDKLARPWISRRVNLERVITRIEGKRIFIDAPVTTAMEAKYGGGTIHRYTWDKRLQNSGIEDIKGISSYDAATRDDEEHGWVFIGVNRAENCWARRVVSQHFGYACVSIGNCSRQISVLDSQCLDPVSQVTGGRRYAFNISDSTLCLISNCYTRNDRHQYVSGSETPGPHAFVSSSSDNALNDAGPHHRWGSALLFDRIISHGNQINVRNRGNSGTGHGWAGANCVVWNSQADGFTIQNPPTARNWLIGSIGTISGKAGTFDSNGANVFPGTLWGNQRQDAQAEPNLEVREYGVGDMDEFTEDPGESTPVDRAWQTQVARKGSTVAFDALEGGRWVPWTHDFTLGPDETIASATLWVSLRGMSEDAGKGRIYLDDLGNSALLSRFSEIIPTKGSTVLRIDLASQLSRLSDGQLNLAVQDKVAVDWSLLELRVACPGGKAISTTLAPSADATIAAGASALLNFGAGTTVTVRKATSADKDQLGLLKWNLSAVTGKVRHAKIRLTPVSVGAEDLENGAAITVGHDWTEKGIAWSNQPAVSPSFVSWWPQAGHPVEFVVTSEVLAAMARGDDLSVQLFSTRESAEAAYASKEHPEAAKRPQLILVTE